MNLSYTIDAQPQLIQKLMLNELDCVLAYDLYLPEGLRQERLASAPVYAMVAADHPAVKRGHVSLKELEDEPVVLFDSAPASTHSFSVFQRHGITPQVRYRGTEYELIRGMIARGLGYSLMVHRPAHHLSYEGLEVAYVTLRPAIQDEHIVGLWPEGVNLNPRARAFLEAAGNALENSPMNPTWSPSASP